MKTTFLRTIFLCLWLFNFTINLHGQGFPTGLPEIINYTSRDYQWHPKNFKIIQGKNGLIYIGNSYGILEFDGKTWNQISLPNALYCNALTSDKDGRIVAGSYNELGSITFDENGTSTYQSISWSGEIKNLDEINDLHAVQDQIIILSNHAINLLNNEEVLQIVSSDKPIVYSSVQGNTLFYQIENSLKLVNLRTKSVTDQFDTAEKIVALIDKKKHAITETGKVLDMNSGETLVEGNFAENIRIRKVTELQSNQFALATTNHGLLVTDSLLNIIHHIDITNGLLSNQIYDVMEDQESNLWLALDNGISHVTINTPFTQYATASGVHGMGYASISYNGILYLGTTQGVYAQTGQNRFNKIEGADDQVYDLAVLDDQLWLSAESGLYMLRKNQFERISPEIKVWKTISIPRYNQLLLSGTDQGLFLLNKSGGQWLWQSKVKGFEESSRVLVFDENEILWMVHGNKGVFQLKLDIAGTQILNSTFFSQAKGNLPVYISNATQSRKGVLFSSANGVYLFNDQINKFEPDLEINKYLGDDSYVDNITEGIFGNLWLIQENMISKLDLLDNGAYTLLPENMIRELSGRLVGSYEHLRVYDRNNIIIGTQEGFAHFNVNANINYRKNLQDNEFQTKIRSVKIGGRDSTFFVNPFASTAIILPHFLNHVTITYAPGFYQSHGPAQFSFYLENKNDPQDLDWEDWHSSNQNVFENLAPGRYVFHVKASGDLVKNAKETTFRFTILEPWFASRLSFALYTLAALALGFVIYKYRVRKIKAEKQMAIHQKEEELEQQKLLAQSEKMKLINERLKEKVTLKNKELGSVALEITQKNEFLAYLKKSLTLIAQDKSNGAESKIKKAIRSIDQNMRSDNNWERFELYFDETHQDFIRKLKDKHTNLTKSSISLCAFLHLDLSTKEIASLMNISPSGVEKRRYRLRKKLDLDMDINLNEYLNSL